MWLLLTNQSSLFELCNSKICLRLRAQIAKMSRLSSIRRPKFCTRIHGDASYAQKKFYCIGPSTSLSWHTSGRTSSCRTDARRPSATQTWESAGKKCSISKRNLTTASRKSFSCFVLLSAAEGQRSRNYLSCCCCIFCLIYALSTPTTVLHSHALSLRLIFYLPMSTYLHPPTYIHLPTSSYLHPPTYIHLPTSTYLHPPTFIHLPTSTYVPTSIYLFLSLYNHRRPRSRCGPCYITIWLLLVLASSYLFNPYLWSFLLKNGFLFSRYLDLPKRAVIKFPFESASALYRVAFNVNFGTSVVTASRCRYVDM